MRNPFKRKEIPIPAVGSIWWLKSAVESDNPFQRNIPAVEVKDVKSGWVNYRRLPAGGMFQDESMKLESFHLCYIPKPE
jgi:hypothetical protein